MHKRVQIKNATIVNEGRQFIGSLLIDNNQISQIVEGYNALPTEAALQVFDAEGLYLLPGVIDTHVHFREPGYTDKADWDSETRAAAAGGVTTVFDMPNTKPFTTTIEDFHNKMSIARAKSHINFGLFFGATTKNYHILKNLNPRKIAGIKLFMGASTGNMLVEQETALENIFQNSPTILVTHCEHTPTIADNLIKFQEKYGDDPSILHHHEIRSEEACFLSTSHAVKLAEKHGTRLHVAHISTEKELSLFGKNPQITAEACLPHLLFSCDDYRTLGTRIKCNPSIKTNEDREAIRNALNTGQISTIGTDHAPHLIKDKVGGSMKAVSGMPMIQFSLLSMLELTDKGILSIERLVDLMCHQPAAIFQIENRGFLRPGYKADFVLVRPNTPWTLTPNQIQSKCNWSPLEGHTFKWKVEKTFCNGYLIYNNGTIVNESIHGLPVTFAR